MSGNYYRVMPEPPKVEGYGFKKVSQAELSDIVSRVTKATYSSRVLADECRLTHNYRKIHSAPPPRTPSDCNRRYSTGSRAGQTARKLTERDLQRLLRRIQKPTKAFEMSQRPDSVSSVEPSASSRPQTAASTRPTTATEKKKALHLLTRPTTASRAKSVTECHLCDEENKENMRTLAPFEYIYSDGRRVSKEEVESITSRVRFPTKASERGTSGCSRATPDFDHLRWQSQRLPLVSGLERSGSVSQIVGRLHHTRGNYRRNCRYQSTQATPITDFYAQ